MPAMNRHRVPFASLLVAAFGWGLAGQDAAVAQTLTTAREIAAHVTPADGRPPPIGLEATVTFQDPSLTIFLRDETGVTFIRAAKDNPKVNRGDRLRMTGETHNGLIIGGIKPSRIETLGSGAKVEARQAGPDDLASGRFHYDWIVITGVGRSVRSEGENAARVVLNSAGRTVELRVDESIPDAAALVDAELRVRGLAAGDINDRRQLVLPYVRVGGVADIEVLAGLPPDPFAAPLVPVADLHTAGGNGHRVRIRGVALGAPIAGGLFLRDGERCVFVRTDAAEVKAGEIVEALGFVEMGVFSAQLADAVLRVIGSEAPPEPLAVTAKELTNGTDADLIRAEARVLQRFDREAHTELLAQADTVNFTIILPGRAAAEVQADSWIRIVGLCRVTSSRSGGYRARPASYNVWPRSADDLTLLRGSPNWNAHQLALGLAAAAALAFAALVWVALLRRQVGRQLSVIEAKAQREAIAEERQRIAREFHDTLEQELAGLSLRLDATTVRVTDERARALLEQQRKLLGRIQTEARDFVWDLRDASRQEAPLDAALRSLVGHLQATTTTPLHFRCEGCPPALPPLAQHHLLRITREAVNNAMKYAAASCIDVMLRNSARAVELSVADDGNGFDLAEADALEGHFGLRGMRERAKKLGTALDVRSERGRGTRVGLTLALPVALA
jgi:signal transduction histidine kinase